MAGLRGVAPVRRGDGVDGKCEGADRPGARHHRERDLRIAGVLLRVAPGACVRGDERELRVGERGRDRRAALCSGDRLFELRDRRRPVSGELRGDAAEDESEAPPWALGGRQLAGARRVGGHRCDAVPTERGAERSDACSVGRRELELRGVQCALSSSGTTLGRVKGRGRQPERGLARELARGEGAQPLAEHRFAPVAKAAARQLPQHLAGARDVASGGRVPDGHRGIAVAGVPRSGAAVQTRLELRLGPGQLGAQHGGDERVMAERDIAAVHRLKRRSGARESLEPGSRASDVEHRVAERAVEFAQQGRATQERPVVSPELGEQLVAEVLGDDPVRPAEVRDRSVRVRLLGDRQSREIERRGPALCALDQPFDLLGGERDAGRVEEHRGFEMGHRELTHADLQHEPVRAKAAVRLAGSGARQHGQRGPAREATRRVEQVSRHARVSALRVVDDDDVGHRALPGVVDRAQRSIGCAVVAECHPAERPLVTQCPLGGERRLAVPGGSHHQHDRRVAAGGQPSQEVRSGHGAAAQRRRHRRCWGDRRRGDALRAAQRDG